MIDALPTLLALANVPYPDQYQGNALTSLDGTSLLPVFAGQQREPHANLFFEHEDGAALIQGDYKIVRLAGNPAWELYDLATDLATDRAETKDLATSDVTRVQSMSATWQTWCDSAPH